MFSLEETATLVSSLGLRGLAYIFFRWIPGHHAPPAIYSFFAAYIASFFLSSQTQARYNVIEDNVEVTVIETETEEKIEVDETLVLEERSAKPWRTLLTGLPSPTSTLLSAATFLINAALVFAVVDYVYGPKAYHPSQDLSFARVGYVSPTEANLLVREPNATQLPIFVSYRLAEGAAPYDDATWQTAGTINALGNGTDYTATVSFSLPNLPDRKYQWVTSNNHTGYITVPPRAGQLPKDGTFTFVASSCIKPRFPYNPLHHSLSVPGFKYLANVLKSIPQTQFMMFLGDFIYIDVPKRHSVSVEDYRREYRQVYASPDWPSVGQNLSWIHVLDDHEIANDWDKNTTGVYEAAVEPYRHYHASVNPPRARKAGTYNTYRASATYFEFTQGPASFFMLDTRTYRTPNALPLNSTEKSMLGQEQLQDLLAFLQKPEPKGVNWKFIISSVPFTKNWGTFWGKDTWAGYLHERRIILEAMWDVGARGGVGAVVISGDRHEFAATSFPPPSGGKWPVSATVHEYSVSPLSQFYLPYHTYKQVDDEDVMVKYLPSGNSKLGTFTIENASSDQSSLKFRLYIDGTEAWSQIVLSPPVGTGSKRAKDAMWG